MVDKDLAGLPTGFYVKSFSSEIHADSHHLSHNESPFSFSESKLSVPITAIPTLQEWDLMKELFWNDAAYLYSLGYTETQAFNKLQSSEQFATVISHLDSSPSKFIVFKV